MMNLNCMNCGAMLLDGATVCPVCRQPVGPAQRTTNWQQQQGAPQSAHWQQPTGHQPAFGPPPLSGNNSSNVGILVAIGVLLLLLAAGVGGFLLYLSARRASLSNDNYNYNRRARVDPSPVVIETQPPILPSNRTANNSRAPISGGVLNGKAIELPKPAYPAIARAAKASGTVVVQVTVDESGNVINARAIAGHPLLQQAAVQAARQARFSPTTLAGKPVKVTGTLSYNFVLE